MKIKNFFKDYEDDTKLLDNFKVSVINSFEVNIASKIQEYEYHERHYFPEDTPDFQEEYEWNFNYLSPLDVLAIMNSLGESVDKFELISNFSDIAGEPYHAYKFNDVWTFLKEKSSFDFLIAMVSFSISENGFNQISTNLLNDIILNQLKHHSIDYYELNQDRVFIAMSFSEEMKIARQSICKAVELAGYKAVLIDVKEHNNFIVPEIFSEIKKSVLVIADLTEQRAGVYFEAGFALGKEIPVILSCRKDDFGNNHFDVSQINTIVWENEEDLQKRLLNRIKSSL